MKRDPGYQQLRSKEEQAMPEWQRNELDRRRAMTISDRAAHPAIMEKLNEIERKIDAIFAKLLTKT